MGGEAFMEISMLSDEDRIAVCRKLREAAISSNITQEALAAECGCDPKTIRKIFDGQIKRCTPRVKAICNFIGIEYETLAPNKQKSIVETGVSAELYGAYLKTYALSYIGRYIFVRRAFTDNQKVVGSIMEVGWCDENHCLDYKFCSKFVELEDELPDIQFAGKIYMNPHLGFLHLVTVYLAAVRTITLSKIKNDGTMSGALLAQAEINTGHQIAVSPVHVQKLDASNIESFRDWVGIIKPNSEPYSKIANVLSYAQDCVLGFGLPTLKDPIQSNFENVVELNKPLHFDR